MAKRPVDIDQPSKARISEDSVTTLYKIRAQETEKRDVMMPAWRESARLFNPYMTGWDNTETDKDPLPNLKSMHSTKGMKASSRLTDGIQAYGFSRNNPWLRLVTDDEDLMERPDVAEWCQKMEVHSAKQLERSNYYDEGRLMTRVCADMGTGIEFRIRNPHRAFPTYKALHLARCLIMEDQDGEPDTLFRDLYPTAFDAAAMFGLESLPQTIKTAFNQNSTRRFLFTQFIFPLDKFDLDMGARTIRGMPFYSVYVADAAKPIPVAEGGYEKRPWWAWRWCRSMVDRVWGGDCPGLLEVPNARQANGMARDILGGYQLNLMSPLMATMNLQGRLRVQPKGVTWMEPGDSFTKADVTGDPSKAEPRLQALEDGIEDSYHTKLFLILSQTMEQQRTLGEAGMIKGEQAAMLTAFMGRMSAEFLEPSVEDLIELELEAGRAPPPPKVLWGRKLKVMLVSPLALLQKRYLLLDPTRQWLSEMIALKTQLDQGVVDIVDVEQYARRSAELYHVDLRVIRDVAEVEKRRQARIAKQNLALATELAARQAEAKAKTYAAGAKAPEPGSPAGIVLGAPAA